jgi:hypothetical protein
VSSEEEHQPPVVALVITGGGRSEHHITRTPRRAKRPTTASILDRIPTTRSSSATVASPAAGVRFGSSQRNSTGRDVRRTLVT